MKTKYLFLLLALIFFGNLSTFAQDTSAIVDFESTTQGVLIPRMLNTERVAISMPANGLLVYQTNAAIGFYFNYGTPVAPEWRLLGNDGDTDPTNEIETWSTLGGIPAGFSDNIDNINDADSDPNNEIETWSTLSGIPAGFSDNIDNINDADSDPNNEIETWSTLGGIPAGFSDNIDNINDADSDPTNEIELPTGGGVGQFLQTDGAGTTSWADISLSTDLGIGTTNPLREVHINGPDSWAELMITPDAFTQGDTSSIFLAEDEDATYGMSIMYDGVTNQMKFFGKSISNSYGPHMTIERNSGNTAISSFTQLGDNAPKIKMKKLTMTTASTQGGTTNLAHGIDANKILSIESIVQASGLRVPPGQRTLNSFEYGLYTTGTVVYLLNAPSNSASILSAPARILITYEE